MTNLLNAEIFQAKEKATATIIWLHGLGANSQDFSVLAPQLQHALPFARFIFPNAPIQPVTINGNMVMPSWYDIFGFEADSREDEAGLIESESKIKQLIQHEQELGINSKRIILGGFSQGGATSLYTGLRFKEALGGIFGLSSYLPLEKTFVVNDYQAPFPTLPFFFGHGTNDPVVLPEWGITSRDKINALGYSDVSWNSYPGMEHSVCEDELRDLVAWFNRVLS